MRSVADCDDGLGNAGNLAIEEILHLFEPELMADQSADVHLARRHQRDGVCLLYTSDAADD